MWRNMTAVLLASLMILMPLIGFGESDPVVVRVGSKVYLRSEVETWLNQNANSTLSLYTAAGGTLSGDEGDQLIQLSVQHFILKAIVEDKAAAEGLDTLTEA